MKTNNKEDKKTKNENKNENKNKKEISSRQILIKIVAFILVILMLGTFSASLIFTLM